VVTRAAGRETRHVNLPNLPHSAVLYVDDDPRNLHAFRLGFKGRFRVLTAASAREALDVLAREPVAVLLADQRMPEMSGSQLCAQAKKQFPDIVRMILTAYSDIGAVVEAINTGEVSRYFIKPWREEELADAIRAGIDAFQLVTVTRDLQVRLLQQEQQSTTTYLLGRVLHEVVSPAVGIRDNLGFVVDGVSQLAQMAIKGDPDVPRVANDLLPALTDAHDSAIDLVGRIERFRRGEAPAVATTTGTSLDRAIQTAAGIVRPRLADRARLIIDTNHKAAVKAEPTQLTQIVVNLLLNAYEAIAPGAPEQNQVTVTTVSKGDRCGFVVEDTGPGIPEDIVGRIFEPFFSTKVRGANTNSGLGLPIVHEIVTSLGGTIEVDRATRGTRFYVELPRAD
jgi:signal transduction histidine kinase